jgi:hypothetical protein
MVEILLTGAVRSPDFLEKRWNLVDGGGSQKQNPRVFGLEKSDRPIVLRKRPNNPCGAEVVEGRGLQMVNMTFGTNASSPNAESKNLNCVQSGDRCGKSVRACAS